MGGVAEVYEAAYQGKRCALKVLQRRFHFDAAQLARADKEATVLTRIRHANVIDVHDAGVHEGIFWMRMELVDGVDLRTAFHRLAPMSVGLAGAWLVQAAHGAHQCHAFGVIHRDIKPENIFITRQNVVKIIDLGIAKMYGDLNTVQGNQDAPAPIGTAPYMSPEQARGEPVSPVSDVYALGMSFWEAVVGEHPFLTGGAVYEYWSMLHKQVNEEVPPLSDYGFPFELSDVIARSLSKRRHDRQPNALAFARELCAACNHHVQADPGASQPGEPTVIALLDKLIDELQNPSFGTGPLHGRRSSLPRLRRSRSSAAPGPPAVALSMSVPRGGPARITPDIPAVPDDEQVTIPLPRRALLPTHVTELALAVSAHAESGVDSAARRPGRGAAARAPSSRLRSWGLLATGSALSALALTVVANAFRMSAPGYVASAGTESSSDAPGGASAFVPTRPPLSPADAAGSAPAAPSATVASSPPQAAPASAPSSRRSPAQPATSSSPKRRAEARKPEAPSPAAPATSARNRLFGVEE